MRGGWPEICLGKGAGVGWKEGRVCEGSLVFEGVEGFDKMVEIEIADSLWNRCLGAAYCGGWWRYRISM